MHIEASLQLLRACICTTHTHHAIFPFSTPYMYLRVEKAAITRWILQHGDPASARGRRRGGGGSRSRSRSRSRPTSRRSEGRLFEREMAPDPLPGPVILTRAELQRRTRERSRLAALKIAEEHGKVRKGPATGMGLLCSCDFVRVGGGEWNAQK